LRVDLNVIDAPFRIKKAGSGVDYPKVQSLNAFGVSVSLRVTTKSSK